MKAQQSIHILNSNKQTFSNDQMNSTFTRTAHKCQVDCTNHDEVINTLELKSKDLYYFWRNYQWLYNKYYAEKLLPKQDQQQIPTHHVLQKVKENHQKCNQIIESLENQLEKEKREAKKLRIENQSLKKQISAENNTSYEEDYKREIQILKKKHAEQEAIESNLSGQIRKLKNSLKEHEQDFQNERVRYQRESKKSGQTIIELQQSLDELRGKNSSYLHELQEQANTKNVQPTKQYSSYEQIQQRTRKQSYKLSQSLREIERKAARIVEEEIQFAKKQLLQALFNKFSSLSLIELQNIIVDQQEY